MRFLGVTETCDLAALYLRLRGEGHDVRICIEDEKARGTLAGMVPRVDDWRAQLDWVGRDGVIVFEAVSDGFGALQDELRRDGFRVIGGSDYGDRLENDRAFAQGALADLGFQTAETREFTDGAGAIGFIAANPARYVLKFSGTGYSSGDNYVGRLPDGRDVRAMIAGRLADPAYEGARFVLMRHVEGVEMGVGAYFDGEGFITPGCLDWEHKRFFAGDMGELTGEMGTVVTYERTRRFFDMTLARITPLLRGRGHTGYVNLNTIVNEEGIWPLEFTCRFGYPGYAVLAPLQETGWADLFRMMLGGMAPDFRTRPGFCTGVVLTAPPFPYSRKEVAAPVGLPVFIDGVLTDDDRDNLQFGEVGMEGGQLVTSGLYGWTMVATGTGADIAASQRAAYARAARVFTPDVRYRLDIGDRLRDGDYARVERLGLLDPA